MSPSASLAAAVNVCAVPLQISIPFGLIETQVGGRLTPKSALTVLAASIVTTQVPVPEQPLPDQPLKIEPLDGLAVKVTLVPWL